MVLKKISQSRYFIRLLSKLAAVREVQEEAERRTVVYVSVHEDSSTASTKQISTAVGFGKKSIVFVLMLMFALPAPIAYWCYLHPDLFGQRTNQGHLLKTPIKVTGLAGETTRIWRLVYVESGACTDACVEALTRLAKVRLALGRRAYSLQVLLADEAPLNTQTRSYLREVGIKKIHPILQALPSSKIWIINPEGYAVLWYEEANAPYAIFHDLQQLIR